MDFSDINFNVLHFDRLPSSNIHAQQLMKQGELQSGDVIWTDFQEQGKGQRGKAWSSNANENLLFSVFLHTNIPVEKVYVLNKLAALSVVDLLDNMAVYGGSVKWPNDVLVNGRKVCGILIENSLQGQKVHQTLIGMGLNVNQTDFPEFDRAATSLCNELGKLLDRQQLLQQLFSRLKARLMQLENDAASIDRDYLARFYGLGKLLRFKNGNGDFKAKVRGVDPVGKLILEVEGKNRAFEINEIRFID